MVERARSRSRPKRPGTRECKTSASASSNDRQQEGAARLVPSASSASIEADVVQHSSDDVMSNSGCSDSSTVEAFLKNLAGGNPEEEERLRGPLQPVELEASDSGPEHEDDDKTITPDPEPEEEEQTVINSHASSDITADQVSEEPSAEKELKPSKIEATQSTGNGSQGSGACLGPAASAPTELKVYSISVTDVRARVKEIDDRAKAEERQKASAGCTAAVRSRFQTMKRIKFCDCSAVMTPEECLRWGMHPDEIVRMEIRCEACGEIG